MGAIMCLGCAMAAISLNAAVSLNAIEWGASPDRSVLMIVHGLYGSARNWGAVARPLAERRRGICPDLRNHGHSPWADSHSYLDMAADLARLIDSLGPPIDLLGHSMGGKAAMALALLRPQLVRRLIIADIAPVAYSHSQLPLVEAMQSVDLRRVQRRSDALAQLRQAGVTNASLRDFLVQSLDIATRKWRLNLAVLAAEMPKIMAFPDIKAAFSGPALFLGGAQSDYTTPDHRPLIQAYFPKARFVRIAGAGHWLHADRPQAVRETIQAWLEHP